MQKLTYLFNFLLLIGFVIPSTLLAGPDEEYSYIGYGNERRVLTVVDYLSILEVRPGWYKDAIEILKAEGIEDPSSFNGTGDALGKTVLIPKSYAFAQQLLKNHRDVFNAAFPMFRYREGLLGVMNGISVGLTKETKEYSCRDWIDQLGKELNFHIGIIEFERLGTDFASVTLTIVKKDLDVRDIFKVSDALNSAEGRVKEFVRWAEPSVISKIGR